MALDKLEDKFEKGISNTRSVEIARRFMNISGLTSMRKGSWDTWGWRVYIR